MLGGITVLRGQIQVLCALGTEPATAPTDLTMVPYYAWAHRGAGEMNVWLGRAHA